MSRIKTRESVKDIKVIDKAAVASERMKTALVRSKDLRRYNGDAKFARVHKRIREENTKRKSEGKPIILSEYDESIVSALMVIKGDIDRKVYDRNDILKKDAYFEQTVMTEIAKGMKTLGVDNKREDRVFIQSRITKQYLDQYRETYPAA